MILLKIAAFYLVAKYVAYGFSEEEAKKRDKLKKKIENEKFLVREAYELMAKEKKKLIVTIRELREEVSRLNVRSKRWK